MWIFLNDAFLSIVDKGGDGSTLLVRARQHGDLERVFPGSLVQDTPSNDYRFRARIPRDQVAATMASAIASIGYTNLKGSVQDQLRHEAYLGVWEVMHRYQRKSARSQVSEVCEVSSDPSLTSL